MNEWEKVIAVPKIPPAIEYGNLVGRLAVGQYELTVPLRYEIQKDGDDWYAYMDDLGLPGYGKTKKEAVKDLQQAIVDYYETLVALEDKKLGPIPRKHKAILKDIIEKKEGRRIAARKKRN